MVCRSLWKLGTLLNQSWVKTGMGRRPRAPQAGTRGSAGAGAIRQVSSTPWNEMRAAEEVGG